MLPKHVCTALTGALLLAWGSAAIADEYRSGDYLRLDLPSAVLSPKRLGPSSQFTPGPLDVNLDRRSDNAPAHAEPKAEPSIAVPRTSTAHARVKPKADPNIVTPKTRTAHARAEKPRGAARTKLARQHRNPLDAQASDTRIQVWPCKSGGICSWRR